MAETLDQAKVRLRRRYLGRGGIHGLATEPSENVIVVYFESRAGKQQQKMLRLLEQEAAPYRVRTHCERSAQFA